MSPDQQTPTPGQPPQQPQPTDPSSRQPGSLQPGEYFTVRPGATPPVQPAAVSPGPPNAVEPMIPYNPNPVSPLPTGQFAAPPLQPQQLPQSPPPQQVAVPGYPTPQPAPSYASPQPPVQPQNQPPSFPAQPAAEPSTSPYDFFLNEPKQAKKPLLPLPPKPSGRFNLIMYIAAGVIVGIIILSVILGVANRNKGKNPSLTSIATTQQYIIYTSSSAASTLQSSDLAGFANTARDTTTTAQQQLITYLKQHGVSLNTKALSALKDTQTDNALAAAKSAGTYDASYTQIMQRLLQQYSQELDSAQRTAAGPNELKLISQDQDSVKLLQTMLASSSPQSN